MICSSLVRLVQDCLTDDLLNPGYASGQHCYLASETLYHLLGGKEAGLKPMNIKHEGAQHWFLIASDGTIIDATADQFETAVPYTSARGRGFMTKEPSRRAQYLMEKLYNDRTKIQSG